MVDKVYYQHAAAEVADGIIDAALWTKVAADLAGRDVVVLHGKYIQLRAQEIAMDELRAKGFHVWSTLKHCKKYVLKPVLALVALWVILVVGIGIVQFLDEPSVSTSQATSWQPAGPAQPTSDDLYAASHGQDVDLVSEAVDWTAAYDRTQER